MSGFVCPRGYDPCKQIGCSCRDAERRERVTYDKFVRILKIDPEDVVPWAQMPKIGEVYRAQTNSHGAVSAVMPDLSLFGLRPGEYEYVEGPK